MDDQDTISHVVVPINERNEFIRSLKNGRILIVKAYADWCGPCKKISPLVDKLLNRMPKECENDVFRCGCRSRFSKLFENKKRPNIY